MPYLISQLDALSSEERTAILRATTITLEAHNDWDAYPGPYPIEQAHDHGGFNFHFGLPDGSEVRRLFIAGMFGGAISTLAILKKLSPGAKLMLSCDEGEAEICGPEVCRGIVSARASLDDPLWDHDWSDLAEAIAANDTMGGRMNLRVDDIEVFGEIESYLLGESRHVFEPPTDLAAWAAPDPVVVQTINLDDLDYEIVLNRRRQRVRIGDRPSIDMNPDDFVAWCHAHDVKLRSLCPMLYEPEFPSDDARETFKLQWMMG